jgi:hypothetical protein
MVKVDPVSEAVSAILLGETGKVAEGILVSVSTGWRIATVEDRSQASDTLSLLRRSAKRDAEALTEAFRPVKARMESLGGPVKARIARCEAGAATVEREMRRWDSDVEAKRREAARIAQAEADAAAKEAAEQAALLADDDEPLAPAQVVIPQAENMVRGAVGKDHKTRRTRAAEIVDISAIPAEWRHLVVLDKAAAKAEYDLLVKRGTLEIPPDLDPDNPLAGQGRVVGGIRFVSDVSYTSGRA